MLTRLSEGSFAGDDLIFLKIRHKLAFLLFCLPFFLLIAALMAVIRRYFFYKVLVCLML